MAPKVAFLVQTGQRPGLGVGAERHRVIAGIAVVVPAALFVSGHPNHPRQRGRPHVGPAGRRGRDQDTACGPSRLKQGAEPGLMFGLIGAQAEVDDLDLVGDSPAQAGFEQPNRRAETLAVKILTAYSSAWGALARTIPASAVPWPSRSV